MKKIFSILTLGAVAAFMSCQKDNTPADIVVGNEIEVSLNAELPADAKMGSKAHGDDQVTRYILEVYESADESSPEKFYMRKVQTDKKFAIRLISGKKYDFVFWADKQVDGAEAIYNTTRQEIGLRGVQMILNTYVGNNEMRDAFYSNELLGKVITPGFEFSTTLKRPFAQLNIATGLDQVFDVDKPASVKVLFTSQLNTVFNAHTGVASAQDNLGWSMTSIANAYPVYAVGSAYTNLATDYIFADPTGVAINFTMEFYNNVGTKITERAFSSVPVKRNYRTNIVGELLTYGTSITVTVVPDFNTPANSVEL